MDRDIDQLAAQVKHVNDQLAAQVKHVKIQLIGECIQHMHATLLDCLALSRMAQACTM